MRRRALLGAAATGAVAGLCGCLGGEVVIETQESVRIESGRGWVQEIDGVDGSGSLSYTVRSKDDRFQVFYFTSGSAYQEYRQWTLGNGNQQLESDDQGSGASDVPMGHGDLSKVAISNEERDVYEAVMPPDDGRYSIDIDGTHYLVVDYSNYGRGLRVPETAEPLQATVGVEVVEDRL